jgi:hypothetical protein
MRADRRLFAIGGGPYIAQTSAQKLRFCTGAINGTYHQVGRSWYAEFRKSAFHFDELQELGIRTYLPSCEIERRQAPLNPGSYKNKADPGVQ